MQRQPYVAPLMLEITNNIFFHCCFFKRIFDVYDEEFANALAESDGDMEYAAFAENIIFKFRLSDKILTNLIEHFSQHKLNLSNVPDDQLGNAYEYLIKEFADDSGHTAAEFYTNRTVVKLMTLIMDP